jgi:phenylalanyl-tRNA synthetase beta chain
MMSNGLTRSDHILAVNPELEGNLVKILNPLSQELDVLRPNILVSVLDNVAYNLNRQAERLRLFEIGKSYERIGTDYKETTRLCIAVTGSRMSENWNNPKESVNLSDLKGDLRALFLSLGLEYKLGDSEGENPFFDHCVTIGLRKQPIGQMGNISKKAGKAFGIKQPVLILEFDLDACIKKIKHADKRMEDLPKFPSVRRDLSLLLDKEVSFSEIEKIARAKANKYLKGVGLFDVYEGKNLPDGKKSYAVSFTIRDDKKTLEDKQIEKIMDSIQSELESALGASLR